MSKRQSKHKQSTRDDRIPHLERKEKTLPEAQTSVTKTDEKDVEEAGQKKEDEETEKKYKKRVVHDNWAKYEVDIHSVDIDDDNLTKENDFSFLANQASSFASHFQTSTEKKWERQQVKSDDIFKLDLKLISSGLSCLPFYERIGLDQCVLTVADVERCNYFAQQNQQRHKIMHQNRMKTVSDEVVNDSESSAKTITKMVDKISSDIVSVTESDTGDMKCDLFRTNTMEIASPNSENAVPVDASNSQEDELVFNFSKTIKNISLTSESASKVVKTEKSEDLEDWLDSILDE